MANATPFYLMWYPSRWLNASRLRRYGEFGKLARHVRLFFTHDPECAMADVVRGAKGRYGTANEQRELAGVAL